jgi:hypothetical protein
MAVYIVMELLFGAFVCVVVIVGVRWMRAMFAAARSLEQISRTLEDIASTLKKDRVQREKEQCSLLSDGVAAP